MSKKRSNEYSQLSKEAYDSIEHNSGENESSSGPTGNGFQRASEHTIRQRRVLQVKRPNRGTTAPQSVSAGSTSNPFQSFAGLTNSSTSTSTGAAANSPPKKRSNPFSGFTALTDNASSASGTKPSTSTPLNAGFSNGKSVAKPLLPTTSSNITQSPPNNISKPKNYKEAITLLNKEYLEFVNHYAESNDCSLLTNAVKDYMKHVGSIEKKFASSMSVELTIGHSSSKVSVPSANLSTNANGSNNFAPKSVSQNANNFSSLSNANKPAFALGNYSAMPKAGSAIDLKTSTIVSSPKAKPAPTSGFSFGTTDSNCKSSDINKLNSTSASISSSGFTFGAKDPTTKTSSGFNFSSEPAATSSSGFNFGSTKDAARPAFSFGSTEAKTQPTSSSGFAFSSKPSDKPTGFSFGGSATDSNSTLPAANTYEEDEENDGHDKEVLVVLKSSDNPDEDCVFELEKTKLLEFKKDEKRWADLGVHPFKLLKNMSTSKSRILMRNQIGKVVLNAALYKGIQLTDVEVKGVKRGIRLILNIGHPALMTLRVNPDEFDKFKAAIENAIPK